MKRSKIQSGRTSSRNHSDGGRQLARCLDDRILFPLFKVSSTLPRSASPGHLGTGNQKPSRFLC